MFPPAFQFPSQVSVSPKANTKLRPCHSQLHVHKLLALIFSAFLRPTCAKEGRAERKSRKEEKIQIRNKYQSERHGVVKEREKGKKVARKMERRKQRRKCKKCRRRRGRQDKPRKKEWEEGKNREQDERMNRN